MNSLYVAVTGATILATGGMGAAGLAKARFVVKNAADVDVGASWVPLLGLLKAAGAIGLLLGILGVPLIGTLSAAGLVAFFIGAICFHLRARALSTIAFPAFFLALASASLAASVRFGPV